MGKLGIHIYTPATSRGTVPVIIKDSSYYCQHSIHYYQYRFVYVSVTMIYMKPIKVHLEDVHLPTRLGIISDTHVDNHSDPLNSRVFEIFRDQKVTTILHLGDLTDTGMIKELEKLAPVYTVRGNRDLGFWPNLPAAIELVVDELIIGMMHGHGTMTRYLWDKVHYVFVGFKFERYRVLLDSTFPNTKIRLFGHTHVAFSRNINGVLYFNPGAACEVSMHDPHPSVGILHLDGTDNYHSQIVYL